MLFEDPILITENKIQIKLPNPIKFVLHKLIISSRRKEKEKKLKDIQQAIYTYDIVDNKKFTNEYSKLPTKARKNIIKNLKFAYKFLPLENKTIDKIIFTLQNQKFNKM